MSLLRRVDVKFADSPNLDAFARLRVSEPVTRFDQTLDFGIGTLFWEDVISATGTVTHLPNESSVLLTNSTGSGDSVARQSRRYIKYQAGKSQLVETTFVLGAAVTNVRRRVGYFDASDGVFLEQDGSTVNLVVRSFVTGSAVDTKVAQASWNMDRLDGSKTVNPSGLTLDLSKAQNLVIDLQWLGVGRVRCGFFLGGTIVYAHEFTFANTLSTVYMQTGNLPVRYEITNTAALGAAPTMRQICSTVISEGGFNDEFALPFSVSNGTTLITITTRRAILSVRPMATVGPSSKVNRIPIVVDRATFFGTGSPVFWELVYDPTLTTGGGALTWTQANSQSAVEYSVHGDANAGAFTGGFVVQAGYIPSASGVGGVATHEVSNRSKLPLVLDAAGANPKVFSLVATKIGGGTSPDVAGACDFQELR